MSPRRCRETWWIWNTGTDSKLHKSAIVIIITTTTVTSTTTIYVELQWTLVQYLSRTSRRQCFIWSPKGGRTFSLWPRILDVSHFDNTEEFWHFAHFSYVKTAILVLTDTLVRVVEVVERFVNITVQGLHSWNCHWIFLQCEMRIRCISLTFDILMFLYIIFWQCGYHFDC